MVGEESQGGRIMAASDVILWQVRCNVTRENEWIFALQQQKVLIPTLKIWAAGRSQKAEFATVQRPKTARNACKSKVYPSSASCDRHKLELEVQNTVSASDQLSILAKKKSKDTIFNRAIFGRSRNSKYQPNIASLFGSKTGLSSVNLEEPQVTQPTPD